MMDKDVLLVRKEEGICTLELNRPEKLNAMTAETYLRLGEALRSISDDGQTKVVVLRGTGEKAFSAGHDLSQAPSSPQAEPQDFLEETILAVEACAVPVIAMIYGYCIGAGCGLATACDLRLAADNARLGVTPARLGIVYPPSALLRLINVAGVPVAKELLYTGKLVDAERAREMRLADRVVPARRLAAVTYDLAREIAVNSPLSVKGTKKMISKILGYQNISPQTKEEFLRLQKQAAASQDFKEGRMAFKEKRRPVFRGI
jgi:enoyl-CoA hydratase/carnithine racemase